MSFCTCADGSIVWIESHFAPCRLSWCIFQWPTVHKSSPVENIPSNKWGSRGEEKAKSSPYSVNWSKMSHFVTLTVYSIKLTQPCAVTEGGNSLRERGTRHSSPTSCLTRLSGSKMSRQQYFELGWASHMSYTKILSHWGGIYCIYTRDRKLRCASEAEQYL